MMSPSAQKNLLEALDQRFDKYRQERQRFMDEISESAVHDLRVATRRLLAPIMLLQALAPQPRLQKLRKRFKAQLDELDGLRDTQVMLAEISERLETLPALKPLEKFLQKREKRLLKVAARTVKNIKLKKIARRFEKTRAQVAEPEFAQALMARLLTVLDGVYETVLQRKERINPAEPASIHQVRVAFKKFRYMVEIVYPNLPHYPEAYLKRMHAYQTLMGAIQDVEVFLGMVREFAAQHASYDPQPVIAFYEKRHSEVIAVYIDNMNELTVFWRASSESPFPWVSRKENP